MSCNLSMVEEKLPPGFRFHPKDDELICDYLMKKLLLIPSSSSDSTFTLLLQVDLNKCEPWDLPVSACVGGKEWYFYSQRDRKYATGLRTNRATVSGYWKATGKDRAVARQGRLVGMRKTLVFYQGRAPKGTKTDWVMHEFRLEGPLTHPKLPSNSKEEDWVLCRVFHKSRESTPPKRMNGQDESGCSSLPDLLDTYAFISFEQTPQHNEDDYVDDNNINNADESSLVPCFSNPNTNPSSSSPRFHVAPSQHVSPYSAPGYESNQVQQDGACDRRVIKAVLSQLSSDVKDSTKSQSEVRITGGSGGTNASYYSDVGFPTMSMWTSHHSHY